MQKREREIRGADGGVSEKDRSERLSYTPAFHYSAFSNANKPLHRETDYVRGAFKFDAGRARERACTTYARCMIMEV